MSTLPSPSREREQPKIFFKSSKTFHEKFDLPVRTNFVGREDTYLVEEVKVRHHNGIFWNNYKKKSCVLMKSGRLFIYSTVNHGISINLFELKLKQQYSEKGVVGQEVKAKCEFVLKKDKSILGICVKGPRSRVTAWRKGMLLANQGTSLRDAAETDELTWSQDQVDGTTSDEVLDSMANCTLRAKNSMASLSLLYHSHTLPHIRNYSDISSIIKSQTLDSRRRIAANSISFYANATTTNEATTLECDKTNDEQKEEPSLIIDCQEAVEVDSGISSPVAGEEQTNDDSSDAPIAVEEPPQKPAAEKTPCRLPVSRVDGIPLISHSVLCFDKAFPVLSDDDDEE